MVAELVGVLLLGLAAEGPVEIVSHRGESHDAPENTMSAFELAWERQIPAIELDAHLTKDGVLAVIHDADTKRTAGVVKQIQESTWDELKDVDVGRWKDEKFAGVTIPRLETALATIPSGCRCFIEIKVGPEAVPALVKAVNSSGKRPEQLVVISFKADTIAEAKRRLPQLKAYYVAGFKTDKATGQVTPTVDELIRTAKEIGADGLDLSHQGPIDAAAVGRIRAANLEFYVWTVDDPQIARRYLKLGVDGITTNRGAWLREKLAE